MVTCKTFWGDGVVVLRTFHMCRGNTVTDLDSFGGIDPHHRFSQYGIEFVVEWLAQSYRYTSRTSQYHSSYGIMLAFCIEDRLLLLIFYIRIKCHHFAFSRMVKIKFFCLDAIYFTESWHDTDTELGEHQLGNSTSCDTGSCLSRRRAPSSTVVSDTILVIIGEVSMSWTKKIFYIVIVFAFLVGIEDDHCDRCSRADALESTWENFNLVILFSTCLQRTFAWFSSVEFTLDEGFIYD